MADNDRFVIIRENELIITSSDIYQIKQLDKFIKTRAEYEDMIAESIYNHTISIYKNSYNGLNPNELEKIEEESKELAKAVVDRLFGEGK